jgi:hypothetical protein
LQRRNQHYAAQTIRIAGGNCASDIRRTEANQKAQHIVEETDVGEAVQEITSWEDEVGLHEQDNSHVPELVHCAAGLQQELFGQPPLCVATHDSFVVSISMH